MYYLYYKESNGSLIAVTNTQNKNYKSPFIKIEFEIYKKFESAEYLMHEWAVLPNPTNYKKVELIKKINEVKEFDPDESIKQIKKVKKQEKNSFIIQQNTRQGSWTIKTTLDDKHLIYYSQIDGYLNQKKKIFVIEEDNPNVLLDTLEIEFKDLLTIKKYDVKIFNKEVAKRKDVSLICSRVEENYIHKVS